MQERLRKCYLELYELDIFELKEHSLGSYGTESNRESFSLRQQYSKPHKNDNNARTNCILRYI